LYQYSIRQPRSFGKEQVKLWVVRWKGHSKFLLKRGVVRQWGKKITARGFT